MTEPRPDAAPPRRSSLSSRPASRRPAPLRELTLARLRMFFREPGAVFWTFGFPVLLTLALGVAFRNRPPEPVYAAVEDAPGAAAVRDVLLGSAEVKVQILSPAAAQEALRTGKAALVVAPGPPYTYRFDPTHPNSRLARLVVDDVLQRAAGRRDPSPVREARVSQPGSRYIDFLVPGLIGMTIMSSGMWGIGYLIVEMRSRKLLKRLVATPMKKTHFFFSFILMRMLFLLFELPVLIGFASLAFSVTVRGSLLLLVALALLGSLAFAAIGLLVASRAQNTQTVSGLINLVMLPMFMCSGVFFSTSHFPDAMQPVIRLLPLTALNDALRAVMNEGAGPLALGRPILDLAAITVLSLGATLRLFRWH